MFEPLESGGLPQFSGTYMERGDLIISCLIRETRTWLMSTIPGLNPREGAELMSWETAINPLNHTPHFTAIINDLRTLYIYTLKEICMLQHYCTSKRYTFTITLNFHTLCLIS